MRSQIIAATCVVVTSVGSASADTRWRLALEGGSEFDSNIHRFERSDDDTRPVRAAGLVRLGARFFLQTTTSSGHSGSAFAFFGSKTFTSQPGQSENVLILQGQGTGLFSLPGTGVRAGVNLSGYTLENYQFADGDPGIRPRTFSNGSADGLIVVPGPGRHRVTTWVGYGRFTYDPDAAFDWSALRLGGSYANRIWFGDPDLDVDATSLDLTASYGIERRDYNSNAFSNGCDDDVSPDPRCFVRSTIDRNDLYHRAALEAVYTGDRIYSARYELQITDTNSHGFSLVRQRFEVKLTTELGRSGFFLTGTGTVLLNLFLDPLLLSQDMQTQTFISIDDENRNSLAVHLSRDLSDRWSAEARYAFYSNEFATQQLNFSRHTAYLGLVYSYEP